MYFGPPEYCEAVSSAMDNMTHLGHCHIFAVNPFTIEVRKAIDQAKNLWDSDGPTIIGHDVITVRVNAAYRSAIEGADPGPGFAHDVALDIALIMERTNCSCEHATTALREHAGDVSAAVLSLTTPHPFDHPHRDAMPMGCV